VVVDEWEDFEQIWATVEETRAGERNGGFLSILKLGHNPESTWPTDKFAAGIKKRVMRCTHQSSGAALQQISHNRALVVGPMQQKT
jgi:hypothetical protein